MAGTCKLAGKWNICKEGAVMKRSVVYCQLQNNLPPCVWTSLKKTREVWDGDIYLICPQRETDYEIIKKLGIVTVSKESFKDPIIDYYEYNTFFNSMYPSWDGFWDNACKRFIYIYLLMREYKIDVMAHIETDVIVYMLMNEMFDSIEKVYKSQIVFTPHEPEALNCGFSYFGSVEILGKFCNEIIEYFKRGQKWFNEKYPDHPIINETLFTYNFSIENTGTVGLFPAVPDDPLSKNLGFLIDPDGWGRWVDGVRYSPGVRYAAPRHHIGKSIIDGKYDVHFSYDGRKIKMPYAYNRITTESFPIATLHFNSKEPEKWI
jgi:hypothetical protein